MEITELYLKISQHQLEIWWSQKSVYWLRYRVASKLNLRPSNLQLMPWNFQIQYCYLLNIFALTVKQFRKPLPICKACINKFYIFRQYRSILYIFLNMEPLLVGCRIHFWKKTDNDHLVHWLIIIQAFIKISIQKCTGIFYNTEGHKNPI